MIKEAVAQGATVQEAFEKACEELHVDPTEADFEVLELPTKKTFGIFGGKPAKVRVQIEVPDPEPEKPAAPEKAEKPPRQERPEKKEPPKKAEQVEKPQQPERPEAAQEAKPEKPKKPWKPNDPNADPAQEAADYLKRVLAQLGVSEVQIGIQREEAGADLTLALEDVSFVIGHRGETLDALQYLASLVANHMGEGYYRITLDVGNYREKRRGTLEALGRRMAIRAVRTGRNTSLEPMNPYERRIIHTSVQSVEGATSWSEGEAQYRHVVIGPEGGERSPRRSARPRSGGYDRRPSRPRREGPQRSSTPRTAPPAEPRKDDPNALIYGKIEVKK